MVFVTVTLLIEEIGNVAAAELCGSLEEIAEVVSYNLEVSVLTGSCESVGEFVICPAEGRSCVTLRKTEHSVVTGIVETAWNFVIHMAVASPAHAAF